MSERDDSRPEGLEEDSSPEGFEDTVVEILSLGDEEDATDARAERPGDAATGDDPRVGSVEMIVRQLHEILKRYGLSPIPAVGERFDPAVHEAVFQEESDVVAAPTVAAELQRGYRLNDRLLRPSLVKVSVPREMADDDSSSDSSQ